MEHAFDQLAAAVRLFLILTALQLIGPLLVVLAGRWWFQRVNSSVLGAAVGTVLGLVSGVLCDGCYFVWQSDTGPHVVYVIESICLTGLYGAFVGFIVLTLQRVLTRRRGVHGSSAA
jgi:drug/metabolite transporter (DMT)-like permease